MIKNVLRFVEYGAETGITTGCNLIRCDFPFAFFAIIHSEV
jgi:hypothetical protein